MPLRELIEICVNGEAKQIPARQSVADLLRLLEINSDRVAVELNADIIRKRDWLSTLIEGGSRIEIVEFVGGG